MNLASMIGAALFSRGIPSIYNFSGGLRVLFSNQPGVKTNGQVSLPDDIGTIIYTDVEGSKLAEGSGVLTVSAQTTPVWGDLGFRSSVAVARSSLPTLLVDVNFSALGAGMLIGFADAAGISYTDIVDGLSFNITSNSINLINAAGKSPVIAPAPSTATVYQLASVPLSTGAYFYVKGGVYTTWTLLFVVTAGNTASLTPFYSNYDAALTLDNFRCASLGVVQSALIDVTSAFTDVRTAVSSLHVIYDFTLNGSPSAGDKVEVKYAYLDASNYWVAYLERNAGNTAWDAKLDSVVAGTPTNRVNVTGVGTPTQLYVRKMGTAHDLYTIASGTVTKRGSTVTNSTHQNEDEVTTAAAVGTTSSRLRVYAVNDAAAAAILDGAT